MSRVQVPDLAAPQPLQRLQITADTYSGAEQAPINNDAERLASALGTFSGTLARVGKGNQDISPTVRAFQDTPDPAARVQLAASGQIPQPNIKEAVDFSGTEGAKALVEAATAGIKADMKKGVWNPTNDDGTVKDPSAVFQELVNGQLQAVRNGSPRLANNEAFNKTLFAASEEQRKAFVTEANDYISGGRARVQQEHVQKIALLALGDIDSNPNSTGEQAAAALQRAKQTLNDKRYGGMDFRRMDEVIIGALKNEADKRPDAVEKLLFADRGKSGEGVPLGRLIDSITIPERQQLMETLRGAKERNFNTAQEAQAVNAAAEAFQRGDGSFGSIANQHYENPFALGSRDRYIQSDNVRERAMSKWEDGNRQQLVRQGFQGPALSSKMQEDAEQAYIGNAIPNQAWKNTLNTAAIVLANPTQAERPENIDRLVATKALYDRLSKIAPGYVSDKLGMSERAVTLMEAADALEKAGVVPTPQAAMQMAVRSLNNDQAATLTKADMDIIKQGPTFAATPYNWWHGRQLVADPTRPTLLKEYEKLARTFASSGDVPTKEAVKIAADVVNRRIVEINGSSYYGDPHITNQNKAGWQRVVNDLVDNSKTGLVAGWTGDRKIKSPADVVFRGNSKTGVYQLWTKDGQPIFGLGQDGKWSQVTLTHAQAVQAQAQLVSEQSARIRAENSYNIANRVLQDAKTPPEQREEAIKRQTDARENIGDLNVLQRQQWERDLNVPGTRRPGFGRMQQDHIRTERQEGR